MAQLIPVKFGDVEIWMESDERAVTDSRMRKVSKDEAIKRIGQSADSISETVKAYCSKLVSGIKELPVGQVPKKVKAEFGIRLSADGKIFIAKASGEASLKVTAEWELA